jgi:hypothetical protein
LYAPQCILKIDEDGNYYCVSFPSTYVSLNYLVLNFFMFAVLTWYLDQVLPSTPWDHAPAPHTSIYIHREREREGKRHIFKTKHCP